MWDKTWAGIGVKGGGILGFVGADTFEGSVFRLDGLPTASSHLIGITNLRFGIGLGGSIGATAVFVFNANTLWEVNNLRLKDWGYNIALPETKIAGASVTFKAFKSCKNIKSVLNLMKHSSWKDIENFRNVASFIYSALNDYRDGANGSETAVVAIDIPGIGSGAELSAFMAYGEFTVDKAIIL